MSSDLMNVSLNALRTLQTVYRQGGISAAADALDVQQPSVSYTLDRLRSALGDPLFLRQGRGIAPTDRCQELMPVVDRILAEVEHLNETDFDPATSSGEITITASGASLGVVIPNVLRRVGKEAPNISLKIQVGYHSAADILLNEHADIVLSAEPVKANGVYTQRDILTDQGLCLMDAANPLAGRTLTPEDIEGAKVIFVCPYPGFVPPFVRSAEAAGIKLHEAVRVLDLGVVAILIRGTDLITGMPSRLAAKFAPHLVTARFPFEVNSPLHMHWAATAHRSQLSVWLRRIIVEEAERLGPPIGV